VTEPVAPGGPLAPQLRTHRMLIRPLQRDDRAEWVRVMALSEALHAPTSPSLDPEEGWDERFDYTMGLADMGRMDGSRLTCVGILADGRIAAFVNLFDIQYGVVECGLASWAVNAEVERQGHCREAVSGLLDLGFGAVPNGLGLHRIQANIMPRNRRSREIAETLSLRCEGLSRKMLRIAGTWEDHLNYAITAEEHTPRWSPG
jgi:ribosomal-protein-alanine N-acetyltransferase